MKDFMNEFVTLGFNAYYWGTQEQNFLLAKSIGPLLKEADRRWSLARMWYDRSTMRGPHIFGLITIRRDQAAAATEFLQAEIGGFMARNPSACCLDARQIAALHRDASGKAFCKADLRKEMAGNNELLVFTQENAEQRYPFRLCNAPHAEALWQAWKQAAFWTLLQLQSPETLDAAAVHFLLACDRLLLGGPESRKEYWAYHASTLVPNLDYCRMSGEHAKAMVDRLVSPQSMARIAAWREQMSSSIETHPETRELFSAIGPLQRVITQPLERDQALLRELVHVSLKQLGIYIVRQIPMVFAMAALNWSQSEIATGVA
jgi:hypothetical protein